MYFDRVFITAEGYDLLGAATAGSQGQQNTTIIWGQVFTSSVDISGWTQTEINSATSSDFVDAYTSSGSVTSAVPIQKEITVDDQTIKVNTVTITIDINNNQHDGIANTLCVFAKLDGGEESKLVIVASADSPETIHPLPQPYNAIVDLYIELSNTAVSEVSADNSWYASARAFNAIANRVVTTHSEDSLTAGEHQEVYGVKTFKDHMYTSHVTPLLDFTSDLGEDDHNYRTVFARTVNQYVMECETAANTAAKVIDSIQAPNFNTPIPGDRILVKFNNGNSNAVPSISIGDSGKYAVVGLRTDLSAGAVVPLTFSGSSWNVDGFLSTANQVAMTVSNDDSEYSIIFTNAQRTRPASGVPLNRELYIDIGTDGNLKYNPGTNTLICTTFDGEATQLSESPVLNFTDATHSGNSILNSTLVVEAGGKTSNVVTIGTVRQAYNTFILTSDADTYYTIPFTWYSSTSSFRTLYTDGQNTTGCLKYNPGTNTLACTTFNGTATRATSDANGNNIANTYISSIGTATANNIHTIRTISGSSGTIATPEYWAHNTYLTITRGSGDSYTADLRSLISQVIAGSTLVGATGNSVGVGAIRLVTFKTSADIGPYGDGYGVSGSLITAATLRTEGSDNENVLRVDSSAVGTTGNLYGTWKILHRIGSVSNGDCVVALAIRIA